jgi:hypothetical protein
MDAQITELLNLCNTDALRKAATECLASGMTVAQIIGLINTVRGA